MEFRRSGDQRRRDRVRLAHYRLGLANGGDVDHAAVERDGACS